VYEPTRVLSSPSPSNPDLSTFSALEIHSGAHGEMRGSALPWGVKNPQDVIEAIGGIPVLLPLFHALPPAPPGSPPPPSSAPYIPTLISLLAAFLRGHAPNCQQLLKAGGVDVVAAALYASRDKHHMTLLRCGGGSERGEARRAREESGGGGVSFVAREAAVLLLRRRAPGGSSFALERAAVLLLRSSPPVLILRSRAAVPL
jgi:hypothetical protein